MPPHLPHVTGPLTSPSLAGPHPLSAWADATVPGMPESDAGPTTNANVNIRTKTKIAVRLIELLSTLAVILLPSHSTVWACRASPMAKYN